MRQYSIVFARGMYGVYDCISTKCVFKSAKRQSCLEHLLEIAEMRLDRARDFSTSQTLQNAR